MAGLRKKRRTTKQALLRRAVIKAGRNADDTVDRSALYDVPQTRSSPQAKAITVLPSFNKDAQLVHIMQRSLSNNSGSSWEPRGAHRITRIKPNKTEAKLQHIFLETPFRSAEQRKEADNGAAKKSGLKKPNTNDNRSGVSLKAFEPSKGSKGSRASSLGYPSSWNLEVPGEDEVSAVVANELSLSEIVNCELLNRTIYDNRLNAPVALRRPTKIDNAVQCVLPQMPRTATLRRKKTAGVQTQTITKRRLLTPMPMQYKIPRLQRIRSRMFPIGTRRSISPTGIIRMDRLLGVTSKGMRPRVYSGKADIHTESVPNNVGKNSRNPKNLRRPASPGSSNDEERGMKKLEVAKDPNYGGYTPSDCSCESKSNDSLDKQNKLTAAPKESSEHYNRIDKISQPPNGKERKHQKPESSSAECKCNGQPGNQLKTHQATCTKVKCPNKSWDSRMANEQEIKEAGNKSGTSGTSSTMHYCYCSQKKSSAKNVVFESQGSNDTEQTQNSSSEQRFAKPASDTKLPKAPGQTCQCPKCSNAVTQTPKRGKNERIATKSKVHSENSSEECICICANCIAKGMGTAQNSKGTSDVCDCKCPTCTKAKSKSQPTNAVREMEGKALSSDRSAKQSSRETRVQKPGRGTMHSPREAKPTGPERRMTLSSREPRTQSPVPGVYPQGTVARPKGRQETVKQLKCQCPKAKVIQALHEFNEYCIYKCPNCSNRVQQPNINAAMYAREGMYGMSPCQCPGCRMLRRPGSPMSSSSHPRSGRDSPTRNPMSESRRHNYNGKRHHEPKKSSSNSNDSSNESIERILPVVTMSSNQDKVNKKVQCDCKCPNCGININDFSRDDRKKSEIDLNPNKLYSQTQPRPDAAAREARNAQEMGANLYGSNRYEANNQDVQEDADRECQICNTIMAKKKYAMASKTKYDVESDNKYDMDPEQKYDMESDDKYDMDREQNYDIDPKQKYDIDRERKYDIDRERKYDIDRERKYDIDREHKYDMDRDTEAKSKYDTNPNRHRRPHCNLETCNKKCNKCKITAAKTKTGDAMVNLVVDDKCNVNQIIQILQETVLQLEGQKKLLSQSVENAVVTQNDNINNVQKNYANGTLTSLNPNLMPEPYCDIRNCPVYKSQSPEQEQLYKATAYTTCPGYNPFQQRKGSPLEGSPQATRRNRNPAVYQDPSSLQYQPTDEFPPHHDRFIAMDPNAPHQGGLRSRSGSTYPLKENSKISSLPREILQKIKPTKSFIDMFHMALALKGNKGYYHNPNAHANFYGQSPKEQEFLDYAQYASNILAAAKRKQVPGKQLARDQSTRDLRFYLHNAPSVEHSSKNSPGHNSPKYPTSKYLKQNFKFSSHTGIGDRSNSPPRLQGQSEQEQRHRRPDRAESHFFRKDNNESTAKNQIAEQHNREDLVRRQPIVCSGIHDKSKNPYFRRELAQRDLFQKHEHRNTGSEYTELRDKSPCQPQVPNIIKENPFLQKRESTGIVPPCEFRTRQIQDMYSCGLEFCRKCPKTSKVLIHRKRCSDKEFKYCSEFCCMEKPNRRDLQKIQPALSSIYGHSKSQSSFGSGRARHRRKMGTPTKRKISYLKLEDFSSKHLESKHSQSSVVNAFRKKLQDLKENSLQNKNSNLSQKYTPIYKVDLLGNTLDPSKSLPSKSRCLYSCKSSEIENKKLTADLKAKKSKSNQSYSQEPNAEKKVKEGPDLSEAQKSEMKGIVYLGRRKTGDNQETEGSDSEFKKFEARKSQYTAKGRAESDFSDHSASKRVKSKTNLTPTRRRAGEKKESEESLFLASKNQSRSTELLARRRAGEKADSDESDHFERNQSVSSIGKRRTSEKRAKEISHSEESKNSNSISFGVYSYLNKTKKGRKVSVELPAITLANDAQLESTNRTKLQGVLALGNRTKKERKPVLITPEKQVKKVVSASSGFASFKHRKSRRNSHKEQSDCDDVKVLYDSSYKFAKHSYGDGDSNDECETDFKRQALFKAQPSSSQNNFFCMLKARDKFMGCHKYSN